MVVVEPEETRFVLVYGAFPFWRELDPESGRAADDGFGYVDSCPVQPLVGAVDEYVFAPPVRSPPRYGSPSVLPGVQVSNVFDNGAFELLKGARPSVHDGFPRLEEPYGPVRVDARFDGEDVEVLVEYHASAQVLPVRYGVRDEGPQESGGFEFHGVEVEFVVFVGFDHGVDRDLALLDAFEEVRAGVFAHGSFDVFG